MSPPDGAEVTIVDPTIARLAAASRTRDLATLANAIQVEHGHAFDGRDLVLSNCAEALRADLGCLDVDLVILQGDATSHRERDPQREYDRAMLPILDEAIGVLEGLR